MKINNKSYALCTKDTHQISCRSSKFCENHNPVQDQDQDHDFTFTHRSMNYISYIKDTHQILFGSADSFESYCVHYQNPRTYSQTDRQIDRLTNRRTDGRTDGRIFFCFFCVLRYTKHEYWKKLNANSS